MKQSMQSRGSFDGGRVVTMGFLVLAFVLTACGGGGSGGGTTPAPSTVSATGQVTSATGCLIAENASSCSASVSYTSANASAPKLAVGITTIATQATGSNIAFTIGNGTFPVTLSDGTTVLDATKSLVGACASGTAFDGNTCKKQVYKYARFNMVVFADKGGYIGKIDDATGTVTPLINGSEFTTGAFAPLALCGIYDKLLDDGRPLVTCVTPAVGNTRRNFPVDPITGTVMPEYKGAVPAGAVARDVGYGTFGDTPYASFGVGRKGTYIDVPNIGTYFFTNTDSVNLRKTTDSFKTSSVINVGDHQFLATFSNP